MSTLKELVHRLANAFSVRASFLFQTQVAATLRNSIMNRVNSERVGESFGQRFQRSNVFPFSNPALSPTLGCNSRTPSALLLFPLPFCVCTTFLRTAFGVYYLLQTRLRRW